MNKDSGGSVAVLETEIQAPDWDVSNWRDQALCRDADPDLFFPAGTTGRALVRIKAAKAVCEVCPAKAACLEFALRTNQEAGVWGGASEEERRKLRSSSRKRAS